MHEEGTGSYIITYVTGNACCCWRGMMILLKFQVFCFSVCLLFCFVFYLLFPRQRNMEMAWLPVYCPGVCFTRAESGHSHVAGREAVDSFIACSSHGAHWGEAGIRNGGGTQTRHCDVVYRHLLFVTELQALCSIHTKHLPLKFRF